MLTKVGKNFYNVDIEVQILSEKEEIDMVHVTYQLNFRNRQYSKIESSNSSTATSRSQKCREICVRILNSLLGWEGRSCLFSQA